MFVLSLFKCNSLKSAFSAIRYRLGPAIVKFILENKFAYALVDSKNINKTVFLKAEVNSTEFTGYDNLVIIRNLRLLLLLTSTTSNVI
jgi:hypothetical protein